MNERKLHMFNLHDKHNLETGSNNPDLHMYLQCKSHPPFLCHVQQAFQAEGVFGMQNFREKERK